MKRSKIALALGVLGACAAANAAPGLSISGSDFQYTDSTGTAKKLFFSGMNLAWIDYNSDVGADALDESKWRKAVEDTRAAGGNAIRWWLFNNMSVSPLVDTTTHLVKGLPSKTIANMKKALDIAEENGVMVSMCLFSHNLMEPCQWGSYKNEAMKSSCATTYNSFPDITANRKLMGPEGTEAFIQKALMPVLEAVGNHKALMSWEIFNEAEGMTAEGKGWTKQKIAKDSVLYFANRVASAIHDFSDSSTTMGGGKLLVSDGCVRADYLPWWTDSSLVKAGGKANGTMDFMQLHYYPFYQAEDGSPFHMTYAQMKAAHPFGDKPLMVGEFPAQGWNSSTATKGTYQSSNTTGEACYRYPFDNGYAGSLAWDYAGFTDEFSPSVVHDFSDAKLGMEALWATDSASIKIKDYNPVVTSGNGVMQVTYSSVNGDSGATLEYKNTKNPDLSSHSVVTFDARTLGASGTMSLRLVTKSGSWIWVDTQKFCEIPAGGKWTTCSFDLKNDYEGVTLSNVQSFLLQTFTKDYSGQIQIDNFKAGSLSVVDFDTQYDLFGIAASMAGGDAITKLETAYITDGVPTLPSYAASGAFLRYQAGSIQLSLPSGGPALLDVYDIAGNRVRTLHRGTLGAGSYQFSLGSLPAGFYQARLQSASFSSATSFSVK